MDTMARVARTKKKNALDGQTTSPFVPACPKTYVGWSAGTDVEMRMSWPWNSPQVSPFCLAIGIFAPGTFYADVCAITSITPHRYHVILCGLSDVYDRLMSTNRMSSFSAILITQLISALWHVRISAISFTACSCTVAGIVSRLFHVFCVGSCGHFFLQK